jgi:hypothetical protein
VTLVMCNLVSIHLETAVLSVHDRCTVCTKRTIVIEIVLDAPDDTPIEIVLDAPDGPPR